LGEEVGEDIGGKYAGKYSVRVRESKSKNELID
jgi:hypothetical protein